VSTSAELLMKADSQMPVSGSLYSVSNIVYAAYHNL